MARRSWTEAQLLLEEAEKCGVCLVSTSEVMNQRLRRLVRSGEALSPLPDMFIRCQTWNDMHPDARDLFKVRTLAAQHPNWVFCRQSAALVHGLWIPWKACGDIHVMTSVESNCQNASGITRHHVGTLRSVIVEGVRVTTLDRTAFDCLRSLSFEAGLGVADSWLRMAGGTRGDLLNLVERMGASCPGVRQAWETASFSDGRSENGGESYARAVMIGLGFEAPELQVEVRDPIDSQHVFRPDYKWSLRDGSIVYGELDGLDKYSDPEMTKGLTPEQVRQNERIRESRIALPGCSVVRFSMRDVRDPGRLAAILSLYHVPQRASGARRSRIVTRHVRDSTYQVEERIFDRR